MTTPWDDGRVAQLTRDWLDGYSAQQCAERLGGGITRNSVISKVHREGISQRQKVRSPRQAQRAWRPRQGAPTGKTSPRLSLINAKRKQIGAAPFESLEEYHAEQALRAAELAALEAMPEIEIPVGERLKLLDLENHHCRWPIGDPQRPDFHFCGSRPVPGLPYCQRHAVRAYAPPKPKGYLPSVHVLAPNVTDLTKAIEEFELMAVRR